MPEKWVSPELVMHYKGANIYHTYRNDCLSEPLSYWYTTDNSEDSDFDIRDVIGKLQEKGIEVPHECDHEAILMRALDNGIIKTLGTMVGRITASKDSIDTFNASISVDGEEVLLANLLGLRSRYRDGKTSFSLRYIGLTRDHVMQTAKALVDIQSEQRSDSIRYEVFGESGIVVMRDGQCFVILDNPKKRERILLKEDIQKAIGDTLDRPIDVPQNVLNTAAKAILDRMKRENRPYWTGHDIRSEVSRIIQHGLCSVGAEYPKFLRETLKELNACLVSSMKIGTVPPDMLTGLCHSIESKNRQTGPKGKRA